MASVTIDSSICRVSFLGLGLIGGSMALALRQSGFDGEILGYGRTKQSLEKALTRGLVDKYTLDLKHAVRDVDLIVLAAPTLASERILREILPDLDRPDGPIITDVASVKGNLLRAALETCETFPDKLVLAHPIAGSEKSGADASRKDLFLGHRVIITPHASNNMACVKIISDLWRAFGAEITEMSVSDHDQFLSATSHLPHILAYALVNMLCQGKAGEKVFEYAAGGFRDFTRIAGSDPVMWHDISLANRDELLRSIDNFISHMGTIRLAIDKNDSSTLHDIYSQAKRARDTFGKN